MKPRKFGLYEDGRWFAEDHLSIDLENCIHVTQEVIPGTVTISREELRERWSNNQSLALSCHPNGCDWLIEELFGTLTDY